METVEEIYQYLARGEFLADFSKSPNGEQALRTIAQIFFDTPEKWEEYKAWDAYCEAHYAKCDGCSECIDDSYEEDEEEEDPEGYFDSPDSYDGGYGEGSYFQHAMLKDD